jgi:uncharacterized membrane protein
MKKNEKNKKAISNALNMVFGIIALIFMEVSAIFACAVGFCLLFVPMFKSVAMAAIIGGLLSTMINGILYYKLVEGENKNVRNH